MEERYMMKIIIVISVIIYFIVSSLFIYFCLVLNSRIEDKPKLKKIKPDEIEQKRAKIDKILEKSKK